MGLVALLNRFKRRNEPPKPADWTQLWEVLTPLGGRTSPDDIARLVKALRNEPEVKALIASQELLVAIRMLDTEVHAQHLRSFPWQGPEQPFRRAAFESAIQAVVAAGPAAVERVLAEPAQLGHYDRPSLTLEQEDALADDYEASTPLEAFDAAMDFWVEDIEHENSAWPSLKPWWGTEYHFDMYDPDAYWLSVYNATADVDLDEPDEADPEAWEVSESWLEAGYAASLKIMRLLGARTPADAATPPFASANVSIAPHGYSSDPYSDFSQDDQLLGIVRRVDQELLDAARTTQQRTDLLVQQGAQAMLDAGVVWAAATVLQELARSGGEHFP